METIERFAEFDENGNFIIIDPPPLKSQRVKIIITIIEEETNAAGITTENIISETAFVTTSTTQGQNPLNKTA